MTPRMIGMSFDGHKLNHSWTFERFWILAHIKKMKRKFVGISNSPRKLTMDAMMTAFAIMIATAKINISAPCVKASRLELYCCTTLSVCRCIVAPDSRSNHANSCRKNIVHDKIHNIISLVSCECVDSTVCGRFTGDSMSFLLASPKPWIIRATSVCMYHFHDCFTSPVHTIGHDERLLSTMSRYSDSWILNCKLSYWSTFSFLQFTIYTGMESMFEYDLTMFSLSHSLAR